MSMLIVYLGDKSCNPELGYPALYQMEHRNHSDTSYSC